jgi:hypothetical protein
MSVSKRSRRESGGNDAGENKTKKKGRKWNKGNREPLDGQGKTISSGSRREYSQRKCI